MPKLQKCGTWYCPINYSYNDYSKNVFIYSFVNHFELYCGNSMIGKGGICVDIFIIKRKKTFHKTDCQVANCHLWENVLWNIGHIYHGERLTSLKGWMDCFELYSGWWKSWSLFLGCKMDLTMTARSESLVSSLPYSLPAPVEPHIPVSIPSWNETKFVKQKLHVCCNCEIISEKSVRVHKVLQLPVRVKDGRVKKLRQQSLIQRGLPDPIKGGMKMICDR